MITQRHRYILLIIIIIYYCHHDSEWHHLSWVLIYILEQFLPLMYAGSTQFSISLSVWVFWLGQPSWSSQTRFPMQWLHKSKVVIFSRDMPKTNTGVSVFIGWSQLLSSWVFIIMFYWLWPSFLLWDDDIFGISVHQWVWVVTSTILPCL